jgi:thiamine thiazole synthase
MHDKCFTSTAREKDVTRAIIEEFSSNMLGYIQSDCIIVGAGPSGLMLAAETARAGLKTLVIEANNYLGGGFWIGGFLMNTITVREPTQEILASIGVPVRKKAAGLYTSDGPHACSKLIAAACDAGAKFLNLVKFDDVVIRDDRRISGAVVNWAPVSSMPRQITCVDPVALECRYLVDASGHDAVVANTLVKRGLLEIKGMGAMNVEEAEEKVVENTREVFPGLVAAGMAVSTIFGLPRMGPTFGAMLLSGRRAAGIILSGMGKI